MLSKVEGRRLTFTVSASDSRGLVAAGKVLRVVVDVERFMASAGRHADADRPRHATQNSLPSGSAIVTQRCGPC